MVHDEERAAGLKGEITKKLEDADLPLEKRAKVPHLNNEISGSQHALQLRELLVAFLDNNNDNFMNCLEDMGSLSLGKEEMKIIERIIEFHEDLVFSYIAKNDFNNLGTILSYCNVHNPFFESIFTRICCSGHNNCLAVAIKRISREIAESENSLFKANFYQRILEHDSVPLLETLLAHEKITWNKALMMELAQKGKYKKVEAYLKNPESYQATKISDSRVKLDHNNRKNLADEIKKAVKDCNVTKLEECLQDLVASQKQYNNLDNLLNETVTDDDGAWKGERLMHLACKQGDLPICKALYRKGASLRVLDVHFHTPAHVAIEANQLHVLQWLHSCDEHLIKDFFEYGWIDPSLNYLFRVKDNNENLPILEYLLSLGCDKLLSKENRDDVLNRAIINCSRDYTCIDTLLKGEEVRNHITLEHLKNEKDNQLLSRLLVAAPRERIEEIVDKKKDTYDKKIFKEWKHRCPEALPAIFSKFVEIRKDTGEIAEVNKNGKLIFREISKLKDAKLLNDPIVYKYIQDNLSSIRPYYVDIGFIILHLSCITWYCISYGMRNVSLGESQNQQLVSNEIWWFFLFVNSSLSIKQFIEFCIEKCKFFNRQDVVESVSYGLSFAVLFQGYYESWELIVIILCLFISWIDLFMKLMVIPYLIFSDIGLYMEMFYSSLKTFIRVLLMFLMFLICFSTAFYTLFHKAQQFRSPHSCAGKTLAMMTGEFDFNDLFFPDNDCPVCPNITDEYGSTIASEPTQSSSSSLDHNTSFSPAETTTHEGPTTATPNMANELLINAEYPSLVAYYVFFVFCICLHLLLLNLLIGLAVNDTSKIIDDSEGRRLRKQAELIADLELFWRNKKKFCAWIKSVCGCGSSHKSEGDAENGHSAVISISKNGKTLVSPSPHDSSSESHPLINGLIEQEHATDKNVDRREEKQKIVESKCQVDQDEMTKTLDLMQEVIFQLHKQNRDMEKRMIEMAKENREAMKKMQEKIDKQSREILDRLTEPKMAEES